MSPPDRKAKKHMQGTIVKAWKDEINAYASVRVSEGGNIGDVEYTANTPLLDAAGNPKTNPTLKADLTAAIAAKRTAQVSTPQAVPITGNVTV